MTCPLCGTRKAKRSCPALGREICAVCCGTKRLVEIACPATCPYLASAREHPPAAAARQHQHDLEVLLRAVRDLNKRQSELFVLGLTFLRSYQPEFHRPIDADVGEAASALAATYETAARGVIYEHRPPSPPAERLFAALKPVFDQAGARGGTAFEREASVVLRRIEATVKEAQKLDAKTDRAFLEWAERVSRKYDSDTRSPDEPAESGRLIVP